MTSVLLLCEYATLNGGERSMLSTLDAVCAAGFRPAVMCPPEGPLAEAVGRVSNSPITVGQVANLPFLCQQAGTLLYIDRQVGNLPHDIELIPFSVRDASGTRRSQSQFREELAAVLRRRRPALLHANSLSMGRLSGPVAAELGVPSLAHLRDIIRLSRQAVADLNCHRRLLAVSEATRAYHVAAGLEAAKTFVLHNGVDLERFAPRPAAGYLHRDLGLPPETPLVGTIGQIGLRKGQDVLLRAAELLADRFPQVHYVIVGERFSDKAESRQFEAMLRGGLSQFSRAPCAAWSRKRDCPLPPIPNGVQGGGRSETASYDTRLHFLGFRNDVDRLLNELTLLVHPARQEPLGRVLLEAAACGVPVIASDVGGTREIFPPEAHTARLVPPDDPAALAAAIAELLLDPDLRRQLAITARRRAETAFGIQRAATALVEHYRQLQMAAQ
jgi:glycosyltransferase involved in cell wall biosynthesis